MRIRSRSWDGSDPGALAAELRASAPDPAGISNSVAATIDEVRSGGDAALAELTRRFDGVEDAPLRLDPAEIAASVRSIDATLKHALETSIENIRRVAETQIVEIGTDPSLPDGQRVRLAEVPVNSAGIYVPGGRAPYPSSVIMGVTPARAAGVSRIAVASPPTDTGRPADSILAAASLAGADEVYCVGGAQAIAALAYGTESIAPVDVVAGPGSPWVQEAKFQCSRVVGIDGYAGPSELLVVCGSHPPIEWVALDLCAQAEHGDDGLLVATAADAAMLNGLAAAIERIAGERGSVADATVELIAVQNTADALALAQALAPEHLELMTEDAVEQAESLTTPGCIFIGERSATAFGDYAAGSNHVLPTGGVGRFTGPLGPGTFRRRIARVEIGQEAAVALAPVVDTIARTEGFPVHGQSALRRRNEPEERE